MVDIPTGVLQETKGIEKGFRKEGVLTYVEELLEKIKKLEAQNAELEANVSGEDPKLIEQYRSDLDNAQKKASEAIRQAQESASQLKVANDKAAQLAAALKTEKEERGTDAQKMKQLLQQAQATSVDEGKIREYQEEILSLKSEISQLQNGGKANDELAGRIRELENKLKASEDALREKEEELAAKEESLGNMQNELNDLGGQIFAKDMQIDELQSKVEELESKPAESSFIAPEMDMSSIFAEAQKNANQLVVQARNVAEKMTKDADAKAKMTIKEADEQAQHTTQEAEADAKRTRESAKEESERILKEAEDTLANAKTEADNLLSSAKKKAEEDSAQIKAEAVEQEKRVRQLTATLRSMLTIEIDSVEKSVKEAGELLNKASAQMSEKINSVNAIIGEARSSVEETTKKNEEKMDEIMNALAPEKKTEPAPAVKNDIMNREQGGNSGAVKDDFAHTMMEDFASVPKPEDNLKKPPMKESGPTPMPKKPKKLNFDMTELIKDAEASMNE